MKLVVVGGQVRKVGKTSVVAGLVRGLNSLAWTAVKISHHDDDIGSQDTTSEDDLPGNAPIWDVGPGLAPAQAAPRGGPTVDSGHDHLPAHLEFSWSEEKDPKALRDTSRFLAAGARRALWMRARGGRLAEALPGLLAALEGDEHVIIESNSILAFLKPAVFLLVIDESRRELKASARQLLPRADALVTVGPDLEARSCEKISVGARHPVAQSLRAAGHDVPLREFLTLQGLEDKPVFPVSPGEWSNPALCRFVREQLASAGEQEIP